MPASSQRQRQILFLDDDSTFLDTIGELFQLRSAGTWQMHLASTTARALTILREETIDLVVIDIRMPVVDGQQFLHLLNRKFPHIKKVVLSGYANEECRTACLKEGAELFLEKPRSAEGFQSVFAALNEIVTEEAATGFRGILRQVGLEDVLQMECLARNSSILQVSTAGLKGQIFIQSGLIIHAHLGDKTGEAALNHLLALAGGDFKLKPFHDPETRTIEGQWEFLLMEAARLRDEAIQAAVPEAETSNPIAPPESSGLDPQTPSSHAPAFAPPTDPAPAPSVPVPHAIQEFIVTSPEGDVLYEWQCSTVETRLKLIELVSVTAKKLGSALALGEFDRAEFITQKGRIVAQIKSDRRLLMVSSPVTPS